MLGERLKALRKKKGMTQKELADELLLDTSSISKYESGAAVPSYEALEKIANYFHVSTDYLYGREKNHYADGENVAAEEILERIKTSESFRMLFEMTKNASEKEIKQVLAIHKAMKDTNPNL